MRMLSRLLALGLAALPILPAGAQDDEEPSAAAVAEQLRLRRNAAFRALDDASAAVRRLGGRSADDDELAEARARLARELSVYRQVIQAQLSHELTQASPAQRSAILNRRMEAVRAAAEKTHRDCVADLANGLRRGGSDRDQAYARVDPLLRAVRAEQEAVEAIGRRMGHTPRQPSPDIAHMSMLLDRASRDHRLEPYADVPEHNAQIWILERRRDDDIAEYRRLASHAPVHDPATGRLLTGTDREHLRRDAERTMAETLKARGKEGVMAWIWSDRRRAMSESLTAELAAPENAALDAITTRGANMRAYFNSLANGIRRSESQVEDWFDKDYLPSGESVLGMLPNVDAERWKRSLLSGKDSVGEVRRRINAMHREADETVALLERAAAAHSPSELGEKDRRLLKSFGYIRTEGGTEVWTVPSGRGAVGNRTAVDLPGSTWLRALSVKNAAITAASVAVPELAAARVAAWATRLGAAERTIVATRVIVSTGTGLGIDAGSQYLETGKVDFARLAAETAFLGAAGRALGGFSDAASKRLASAFKNRETRLKAERFIAESLGLTSEGALETFYSSLTDKGAWPTFDDFLASMVGAGMSRAAAGKLDRIRNGEGPKWLRDALGPTDRSVLADRAVALDAKRREARAKFDKATGGRKADKLRPEELAAILSRGEVSWEELKGLYADSPDEFLKKMSEVADIRGERYAKLINEARPEAIADLQREYREKREAIKRRFPEGPDRVRELDKLGAWAREELDLIRTEPLKPGSGGPTSDIDRSHASARMRDIVSRRGEEMLRLHGETSEGPTSARAFDVNEYYNVMTPIKRDLLRRAAFADVVLPENGFSHHEAVEANSFAAAMLHMNDDQRRVYRENRLAEAKTPAERSLRIKQFEHAHKSLEDAQAEIDREISDLVTKRGMKRDDRNTEIRAREVVYSRRMHELRELEREVMKHAPGSEEWAVAAARLEQKMNVALREGIETYSTAPGVDLVVNVLQGKKPDGSKKTVRELMEDPKLKLSGELGKTYTERDIDLMLNDQVMMMAEHVNHYYHGHEGPYLAARALSKYAERVALGMSIKGMDVPNLPAGHPLRKAYEMSVALQKFKDNPKELVGELRRMGNGDEHEGMRRLFAILEDLPGMKGMTDAARASGKYAGPDTLERTRLRSSLALLHRWERERESIRRISGNEAARDFVAAEREAVKSEIELAKEQLKERRRLAAAYRVEDYGRARRLEKELELLDLRRAHLPEGTSPLRTELEREIASKRNELRGLTAARAAAEASGTLRADPDLELLERRVEFLQGREADLAGQLEEEEAILRGERDPAEVDFRETLAAVESHFEESTEEWTLTGGRNRLRRLPYQEYDVLRNQRYAAMREEIVDAKGPVDLVICFDVSSSMGPHIEAVRSSAVEIVRRLQEKSRDVRIGLVGFRDVTDATPFHESPLSADLNARFADMRSWGAIGGGDHPEAQWLAIQKALGMEWRRVDGAGQPVVRAILVITDAPGHKTDGQGNTLQSTAQAVRAAGDIRVYSLVVGSHAEAKRDAEELAVRTGGEAVTDLSAEKLSQALIDLLYEAFERGDPRKWRAPARFLGDRSLFVGRTIEYQLHVTLPLRTFDGDDILLRGPVRSLSFRARPFLVPGWNRICVELKGAAGWRDASTGEPATDEDLRNVLGDLRMLEIRGQYSATPSTAGLDAVIFGGTGTATDGPIQDEARVWLNRFERWMAEVRELRDRIRGRYTTDEATERLARVMRDSGATQPQFCARNVTADMERLVESAGKGIFEDTLAGIVRTAGVLRRGVVASEPMRAKFEQARATWKADAKKFEEGFAAYGPVRVQREVASDALAYKSLSREVYERATADRAKCERDEAEIRRKLEAAGGRPPFPGSR